MLQAGDQAQGRGLAGTGRTQQHDELAVIEVEIETVDRDSVAEGLAHLLETDVSHARPPRTGPREGSLGRGVEQDDLPGIEGEADPLADRGALAVGGAHAQPPSLGVDG